ncbi:transporter substrate-binding domain-containing protein [Lichenifustis flavocetrariae]|uniref:Transporter substrate-binding domain-containing protein n=1 Tax=Lichenifustis flavocetrariae TaxID=2949735 RepID=A0AA41YZT7_9HYPH|nr:transporter substrate-binding domain-containing protein [Lichenifustis flavocetrariae]MCW6511154.1 transporter substrate-binding domain-containing protein [Lichenifustis flavocetrariae]
MFRLLPQALATAVGLLAFCAGGARADGLADIQKSGVLKVGVFADFPPFSSVGADMSLKGYDIDVAKALATGLKVKLALVEVTGQNRIPYLTGHRVDVLMSVGKNAEREKVIAFTQAYAPYYIAVIGPKATDVKGASDLADKSISVNRGTLEDTSLTAAAPKSADIRRFDNYSAVMQAFLSGQVQLMAVGNDVGAQVLAKHTDIAPEQKFQLLSSPDHLAINKEEPALLKVLDDAIDGMKKDGSLDKVSTQWLGKPLDPKDLVD